MQPGKNKLPENPLVTLANSNFFSEQRPHTNITPGKSTQIGDNKSGSLIIRLSKSLLNSTPPINTLENDVSDTIVSNVDDEILTGSDTETDDIDTGVSNDHQQDSSINYIDETNETPVDFDTEIDNLSGESSFSFL